MKQPRISDGAIADRNFELSVDGRTCRLIAGMMARDKLDLFTFLVIRLVDSLAEGFGKLESV